MGACRRGQGATPPAGNASTHKRRRISLRHLCRRVRSHDVGDAQGSEGLPVPRLPTVSLATLVLEDDNLAVSLLAQNLRLDPGALNQGRAECHRLAISKEQDLVELHRVSGFSVELLHVERGSALDAI